MGVESVGVGRVVQAGGIVTTHDREALRRAVILECAAELDRFGERATVRHICNALLSMREKKR